MSVWRLYICLRKQEMTAKSEVENLKPDEKDESFERQTFGAIQYLFQNKYSKHENQYWYQI